ncbi:hypothetical protein MAPG_00103 [Magnaporthiopsis poae ATCC 64411]|uniref:Uncharacterized protein n=1 Tax=Magnaporthiopsis poae (strain ATCC 64411 / 73-15) TaxID=644358 RepID=A0A0C4DK41_MAGP6|nr:hypothetical protein MAPG_00103 [Magnaporthiopsis poae ATCC 64411]
MARQWTPRSPNSSRSSRPSSTAARTHPPHKPKLRSRHPPHPNRQHEPARPHRGSRYARPLPPPAKTLPPQAHPPAQAQHHQHKQPPPPRRRAGPKPWRRPSSRRRRRAGRRSIWPSIATGWAGSGTPCTATAGCATARTSGTTFGSACASSRTRPSSARRPTGGASGTRTWPATGRECPAARTYGSAATARSSRAPSSSRPCPSWMRTLTRSSGAARRMSADGGSGRAWVLLTKARRLGLPSPPPPALDNGLFGPVGLVVTFFMRDSAGSRLISMFY